MSRIRVGVLRGGPSAEYEVSLKTGAAVLRHLNQEKYESLDMFIDRNGVWHFRGAPTTPERAVRHVDVIFNALHGTYGEDGEVQKLLHWHRVPYTGSDALGSTIGMNKVLSKKRAESLGIHTAPFQVLEKEHEQPASLRDIYMAFSPPVVVKPVDSGSSVGVRIVKKLTDFFDAVKEAFSHSKKVLVEEFIKGKEATVGVVDNFRKEPVYALPPIEIRPPSDKEFFDYEAKYSGRSEEICPGNFSYVEKRSLENAAKLIHQGLGLRHYSRSDFIVSPRGIYFLEVNTLPGLTEESLIPKALSSVGCSFPDFLDHLIHEAIR